MTSIIPKTTKKAPEWYNLAFYISLGLLIVVAFSYAFLFYFESKASINLQDLEWKISQLGTKEEKNIESKVLIAEKKINAFAEIFEKQKKLHNFFVLLEKSVHPKVWFSQVKLNPKEAEVFISGQAANFKVLDQQLLIFRQQESIKSVELTNFSIDKEGEAGFNFHFFFDPQILK